MPDAPRVKSLLIVLVLYVLTSVPVIAQMATATLSGVITDPKGAIVPDTEVTATRIETGTVFTTKTNGAGIYFFTGLLPGHYHLMIHKPGFKEIAIKEFELHVQDKLEQNFSLEIGSVSETVMVTANGLNINTTDATVGTVVDQRYVENMPLNGRSFQDLILLTPGVVTNSPQSPLNGSGGSGEFSVNGQRTESNYYAVDGVSGNFQASASVFPYQSGLSGSLPVSTALGTTQGLVSVDALEEFRVQSSTYSAEYGRNPGGQFSFVTRSGANQWHGTAFDYLRNDFFDANNWFNDFLAQPKSALRQNDFGGTLGGPVEIPGFYNGTDKTFFFFSYEGLRLLQPQGASINYVPDAGLRQSAPTTLQPVLNAFPVANGADLGNGLAEFLGAWSNPAQIDAISIRLDHNVNQKLRFFFRFSDTPSTVDARGTGTFSSPATNLITNSLSQTYTFGATGLISERWSDEFRLNYSSSNLLASSKIDGFEGGTAVNLAELEGLNNPNAEVSVGLLFANPIPLLFQLRESGQQRQWNLVDTLVASLGAHQLKFGVDYRRSASVGTQPTPVSFYYYLGEGSVQTNSVDIAEGRGAAAEYPVYENFSAFVQDEWKVTARLNVSMGIRWEVNPAPGVSQGLTPYTVEGADLGTLQLAPQGTSLWKTTWFNFAPRLGAAYVLRNAPGRETVVRGGGGLFFDTGQQNGSAGFNGPGFSSSSGFLGTLFGSPVSFPLSPGQLNPPIVNPPVAPYEVAVYAFPSHLQLPYTLQWNASVEQALGKSQALTFSYVGSHAARLIETSSFTGPPLNVDFIQNGVIFNTNGGTADYNALQIQFQRRISRGLQALGSYTWSHSLDYGSSNDFVPYVRGNSDFDIRHNFSGALSYDLPNPGDSGVARALLHHWGLDSRFTARTGFPVTLNGPPFVNPATGNTANSGLNIVPGQPIYLYGSQYPGGRSINPSAFTPPPGCTPAGCDVLGDAPRNFVRGFGASQMDLAVRREFQIYERLKLQFRAEAFNIFNHPNFGLINANYCSAGPGCTFGQATSTLNQSLGTLSPLYQMGGPRSMQFALKLIF